MSGSMCRRIREDPVDLSVIVATDYPIPEVIPANLHVLLVVRKILTSARYDY